jgi:hypothetical protein
MSASEPSADELPDPALPSTAPSMSVLVNRPVEQPLAELPVLSNRAMAWAAVALIIIGVGMAAGLLLAFGNGQHTDQLDAIKTAGTIVIGAGGAAAPWLTARRQRITEISLNQIRAAHAATATATVADARRVTDLYTKAADQLGSSQAPGPAGRPVRPRAAGPGKPGAAADHRRPNVRLPTDAVPAEPAADR